MAKRDSIFISYAHDDDKNSNNWISLFKDVLQKELDIQSGQKVSIFFDRDTIEIGDEWKAKIDKTLEERTSHFIAFISMAYLKSEVCLYELEKMLGVERALGKMGMVLPIYFIGSGPMEEIDDPLIRKVVEKNYYDWRQFRFTPPSETEIRQKVAQVVSVILALRDSEDGAGAPKGEAGRPAHRPLSQRAVERKLASISGFVSPSKTVAADNDEVFIRREGCYDEVFSRAVDNALRRHEGKAIVLDLDCRGHEQAHHHLDVLGERAAHLFARVSKRELLPAEGDEVDPSVTYFYLPQSERFFEELCDVWESNGFPAPDLVYSDTLYRKVDDLEDMLVSLRRGFLSKTGGVVFKCFDDGTKICYPDDDVLLNIIYKTAELPFVSDRFNGRKMHASLALSGYDSIACEYLINDTIGKSIDERLELFDESFAYRLSYFEKNAGEDCMRDKAYLEMRHDLKHLRLLFCRDDFFYAETNMFLSATC